MTSTFLKIGTRGSQLALAQAHETRERLARAHGVDAATIEIVIIKTTGDQVLDRPLAEVGGKGLFTKEIEEALIDGRIDLAVHSSKDMPTELPPGLHLSAFLPREDVRDVFIGRAAKTLAELPQGAVVGSSSLRRQAMIRRERPDLKVITFRGNVQSRLAKLERGEVAGTMLALAGLKRLGLEHIVSEILPVSRFLPAVGQGAIAIETRIDDVRSNSLVAALDDRATAQALACERAFLKVLDGSCRTPIAGHATIHGDSLSFRGEVLRPNGSETFDIEHTGVVFEAETIGRMAGDVLKARLPDNVFAI